MTMNRGQAARRRVGKLPPRRSKAKDSSSSVVDQGSKATYTSSSKKQSDSKTTSTGTITTRIGLQQDNENLPHDVRDFEVILSDSALKKIATAVEAAAKLDVDGPRTVRSNISDAEQQSEGKDGEHCDSEDGVDGEAEAEVEHATERKDQEESGSALEDEHDNEVGEAEEDDDASTSGCDSSSSGSDATSSSRGGDVSSSSSSSRERTSPRDLEGCRAEIKRIEALEALGLNRDDYEDRCLLENANLTREEIADVKDRAHRFNVKFTEATRADDGEGWLEGTILRMRGVVRHFERRAEGEERRLTHAERHIVKKARMAMVDCQHVLAKERRRGGG